VDLEDISEQLPQRQTLGGIRRMMGMLPGVGKMKKQIDASGLDDSVFKRQQAIISSMTRKERRSPKLLNASRKKRIAAGSGTTVPEINKLIKMHRGMADMMKKMSKQKGMMGKLFGGGGGAMPSPEELAALGGTPGQAMPQLPPGLGAPGGIAGGLPSGLPGLGGNALPPGLAGKIGKKK
ncbi:MAG: signal recognition particle protein, partial [Pseudomonadota bacterium]